MELDSRALYIEARPGTRVVLDGPALRVEADARAPVRYPLRRLSRVVSPAAVSWDIAALTACLEHGINVSLLDNHGHLMGLCVGMRVAPVTLHERLIEFCERRNWAEYYEIWMKAAERRAVLAMLNKLGLHLADLRAAPARLGVRRHLAQIIGGEAAQRACTHLDSLIPGFVAEHLARSGIAPGRVWTPRGELGLARDLSGLLAWDMRVLARGLLIRAQSEGLQRVPRPWIAESFERRGGRLAALTHRYLHLMEAQLADLTTGYPEETLRWAA